MFVRLAIIPLLGWLCLLFCHGWEGDKCHVWGMWGKRPFPPHLQLPPQLVWKRPLALPLSKPSTTIKSRAREGYCFYSCWHYSRFRLDRLDRLDSYATWRLRVGGVGKTSVFPTPPTTTICVETAVSPPIIHRFIKIRPPI